MSSRTLKGSDPFASKTTRNERFAQMSKQEQLIEQKKREIQRKLDEQQKKETDEALRKLQNASSAKTGIGRLNKPSLNRPPSKTPWKSNDHKWKNDTHSRPSNQDHDMGSGAGQNLDDRYRPSSKHQIQSSNVFSNDGSFLDQFKKLSGVKGSKISLKRDEESITEPKLSSSNDCVRKRDRDSDSDWGNSGVPPEKRSSDRTSETMDRRSRRDRDDERHQNRPSSRWSREPRSERESWQGRDNSPPSRNSHRYSSPPFRGPRPSSPYSPSKETPDIPSAHVEPITLPPVSMPSRFGPIALLPLTQPLPANQVKSLTSLYSAPPPPLHSIPPPLPLQPHSIPPPSPMQPHSIPPPPSQPPNLTRPPPMPQLPTNIPPPALPTPSNIPPPMLHSMLRHSAPPPPIHLSQFQLNSPPPTSLPLPLGSSTLHHPPPSLDTAAQTSVVSSFRTGVSSAAPAQGHVAAPSVQLDPGTEVATNHLARTVAQCGDDIEDIIRMRNPNDHTIWFLHDKNSAAYMQFRSLVNKIRSGNCEVASAIKQEPTFQEEKRPFLVDNHPFQHVGNREPAYQIPVNQRSFLTHHVAFQNVKQEPACFVKKEEFPDNKNFLQKKEDVQKADESEDAALRRKKRRSRWAPESEKMELPPSIMSPVGLPLPQPQLAAITPGGIGGGPMISKVTRSDPALVQYAIQSFGSTNLSEEDWKKAEDHYKINLLYHDMLRKREELDRLTQAGKFKYEYDSDEETDGGTWEHRLRSQEMVATQIWADELTKKAEGKHHIGDFLPPDELERFMEKYSALQAGREPDLSDYKEFKLKEDNIGFQMLQKLGWTEGQGLGSEGAGIVDPVNKASNRMENQGLGLERPDDISGGDDEFEAYRKRMMLAYRFRPNPLNNPRRSYY